MVLTWLCAGPWRTLKTPDGPGDHWALTLLPPPHCKLPPPCVHCRGARGSRGWGWGASKLRSRRLRESCAFLRNLLTPEFFPDLSGSSFPHLSTDRQSEGGKERARTGLALCQLAGCQKHAFSDLLVYLYIYDDNDDNCGARVELGPSHVKGLDLELSPAPISSDFPIA